MIRNRWSSTIGRVLTVLVPLALAALFGIAYFLVAEWLETRSNFSLSVGTVACGLIGLIVGDRVLDVIVRSEFHESLTSTLLKMREQIDASDKFAFIGNYDEALEYLMAKLPHCQVIRNTAINTSAFTQPTHRLRDWRRLCQEAVRNEHQEIHIKNVVSESVLVQFSEILQLSAPQVANPKAVSTHRLRVVPDTAFVNYTLLEQIDTQGRSQCEVLFGWPFDENRMEFAYVFKSMDPRLCEYFKQHFESLFECGRAPTN